MSCRFIINRFFSFFDFLWLISSDFGFFCNFRFWFFNLFSFFCFLQSFDFLSQCRDFCFELLNFFRFFGFNLYDFFNNFWFFSNLWLFYGFDPFLGDYNFCYFRCCLSNFLFFWALYQDFGRDTDDKKHRNPSYKYFFILKPPLFSFECSLLSQFAQHYNTIIIKSFCQTFFGLFLF